MVAWNTELVADRETLTLILAGKITEESVYPEIDFNGIKNFKVDLDKIELMTSIGIQRWIIFFKKIPPDITIEFYNCPSVVSNQINIFPDFTNRRYVKVATFYAPYYCGQCDKQENILLKFEDVKNLGEECKAPGQILCPHCQGVMEFDDIESTFFKMIH